MATDAERDDADLTGLIRKARDGDSSAADELYRFVYAKLKSMARYSRLRHSRHSTLDTTSLVHEFFLRYSTAELGDCANRRHFYNLTLTIMRQILINAAKSSGAKKRWGNVSRAEYFEDVQVEVSSPEELIVVDQLLTKLRERDADAADAFALRRFAGMTIAETAEALQMSASTVKRNMRYAQAMLKREMAVREGERSTA